MFDRDKYNPFGETYILTRIKKTDKVFKSGREERRERRKQNRKRIKI